MAMKSPRTQPHGSDKKQVVSAAIEKKYLDKIDWCASALNVTRSMMIATIIRDYMDRFDAMEEFIHDARVAREAGAKLIEEEIRLYPLSLVKKDNNSNTPEDNKGVSNESQV